MKRWLIAAVLLAGSTVVAQAPPVVPGPRSIPAPPGVRFIQGAPADPAPAKHPRLRGHKSPSNLGHLVALSHQRHGDRLRKLPRATATSFDSRTFGWIGPIKDQGQCGSCWDFSGTGVVEVAYNKAGVGGGDASMFVLSEQYTLSCGSNGGCNGDDNTTVLAWAKDTGLPLTSAYGPYTGGGGLFSRCNYTSGMTLYTIPDWGFADASGGQGVTSVADIKAAIQAYGCVGVAVAADDAFEAWGDNNPSFAAPFAGSGSQSIDHDVILVGWQDAPGDTTGNTGYWILRNSWNTDWGVGGYMAISYGANLVGTEAVFALPPASPTPPAPPVPPTPVPPTPVPAGLTWALGPNAPAGATLDQSGNFTWLIPASQAVDNVTINFTVTPAGGQPAAGSFTVAVSTTVSTVTISPIPSQAAEVGQPFGFSLGQYVSQAQIKVSPRPPAPPKVNPSPQVIQPLIQSLPLPQGHR